MNKSNSSNFFDDGPDPLLKCSELINIGIYVVILFIVSLISNITLIYILIKHKKQLLNRINIQIFVLSILNLIGTLIELPMVGIAAFACKYVFSKIFNICNLKKFSLLDSFLVALDAFLKDYRCNAFYFSNLN
jgi:hypothetical protein